MSLMAANEESDPSAILNGFWVTLFMSGKRGSNPRPSAWEADALPTELLPHWSFFVMPKVMIIFPLCNEKMLKKFFGLWLVLSNCSGFVVFVREMRSFCHFLCFL
jgi:hypothetical protein